MKEYTQYRKLLIILVFCSILLLVSVSSVTSKPKPKQKDDDWDILTNPPHMFPIPTGCIGIGTNNPLAKFHVKTDESYAITAEGMGLAAINATGKGSAHGVFGSSEYGFGLIGSSQQSAGVVGMSDDSYGVYASSDSGVAIFGQSGTGSAAEFYGPVGIAGELFVTEDLNVDGDLEVDGQILGPIGINGDLDITGNLEIDGDLEVNAQFVNLSGYLTVDDGISMPIQYTTSYGNHWVDNYEYTLLAGSFDYIQTIWLPEAKENEGRILNIKNILGKDVWIGSTYGDMIDYKEDYFVLDDDMECVTLQAFAPGGGWVILNHYKP